MEERRGAWRATALIATVVAVGIAPAAHAAVGERAYELGSVGDSRGEDVRNLASANATGAPVARVAANGDAVLYATDLGLLGDDEMGWTNSYRAVRTASGWATTYVGPPGARAFRGAISGIDPSFTRPLVTVLTGRPLDPADT